MQQIDPDFEIVELEIIAQTIFKTIFHEYFSHKAKPLKRLTSDEA